MDAQRPRSLALHQSWCHLHLDFLTHVSASFDHLDFQVDRVSCSSVHVLKYPTNPWVDWEREWLLGFRDSERVVSLPEANVSRVCVREKCVRSRSVHFRLTLMGITQLALFHGQTQDSVHSQQVLLLPALSQVRDKLYVLSQVDFVRISEILVSTCFTSYQMLASVC